MMRRFAFESDGHRIVLQYAGFARLQLVVDGEVLWDKRLWFRGQRVPFRTADGQSWELDLRWRGRMWKMAIAKGGKTVVEGAF